MVFRDSAVASAEVGLSSVERDRLTAMLTREAIDHMALPLAISAFVFGIFAIGFGIVLFRPLPKT